LVKFKQYLQEVQQTGDSNSSDYDRTDFYDSIKHHCKLILEENDLQLQNYHDDWFLVKNNQMIANVNGEIDKLEGKKALFITFIFSKERGMMKQLYKMMLNSKKIKYIVSDQMLSTDAIKFYKKIQNLYAVDLKNNIIDSPRGELFTNTELRIAIKSI